MNKTQETLSRTDSAIEQYCSETTRDKILLARGWQFMPQKAKEISESLSDKELLEQQGHQFERKKDSSTEITMQSVVSNAISQGITSEEVINATLVEQTELKREKELEGETKVD